MFVIENLEIKKPRRLSAKDKAASVESVRKLKAIWVSFDHETRMRATKTIRCLETQGFFR